MTESNTPHLIWRAEEYHDLSIAQDLAASQIFEHVKISPYHHILDVGCGDGKISARLSKIVSEGQVLAIDKSSEMIQFAIQNFSKKLYPNLAFKRQSAEKMSYINQFDVVFSSFVLQWIEHKKDFFRKSFHSLKKDSALILIVPLGISPELEKAIDSVITLGHWAKYFQGFHPNWYFSDSKSIRRAVEENFFNICHFHTTVQEVFFPSRESLEKYILLWFPYLRPLPIELKSRFFQEVLNRYFTLLPMQLSGVVTLKIPRLDLIAYK